MSDEISSVVKMEMDGVVIAVKGTVKTAAFIVQMLKALAEHMRDARINRAGESRFSDIQTLSEGEPPVIMIPEERENQWKQFCKKNKIHYHTLADLNASDGKFPVCIPRQELGMVNVFLKECLQESISESEKTMSDFDNRIHEKREQLINATPAERKKLNLEIEHLQQAKDEVKKVLDADKADFEKEDLSMSFTDYLATGKGTTVEKDPRGVVKGMAEGGESVPIFAARDIFEPIRSGAMVPESKVHFIIPETGVMVTRTFHQDEDGLYYSKYSFRDASGNEITGEKGNVVVFSDKDVTRNEWFNGTAKNANFKDLLTRTGILEGTKCEYYTTENAAKEAINRFQAYREQMRNMQKNRGKAPSFSNADVEDEVKHAASQKRRGEASAENAAPVVTFDVPADRIYQNDGKITVLLGERCMLSFFDINIKRIDQNGVKFSVKANDEVFLEDNRNLDKRLITAITAKEGLELFVNSGKDVKKVDEETVSHSMGR